MSQSDFTTREYPPLSDVLAKHLTGCGQCQESLKKRPVGNLQGTNKWLCSEWYKIINDYAQFEGQVNNIVAKDEYGNTPEGNS